MALRSMGVASQMGHDDSSDAGESSSISGLQPTEQSPRHSWIERDSGGCSFFGARPGSFEVSSRMAMIGIARNRKPSLKLLAASSCNGFSDELASEVENPSRTAVPRLPPMKNNIELTPSAEPRSRGSTTLVTAVAGRGVDQSESCAHQAGEDVDFPLGIACEALTCPK
jgi:hypothetical protein